MKELVNVQAVELPPGSFLGDSCGAPFALTIDAAGVRWRGADAGDFVARRWGAVDRGTLARALGAARTCITEAVITAADDLRYQDVADVMAAAEAAGFHLVTIGGQDLELGLPPPAPPDLGARPSSIPDQLLMLVTPTSIHLDGRWIARGRAIDDMALYRALYEELRELQMTRSPPPDTVEIRVDRNAPVLALRLAIAAADAAGYIATKPP